MLVDFKDKKYYEKIKKCNTVRGNTFVLNIPAINQADSYLFYVVIEITFFKLRLLINNPPCSTFNRMQK